MYAQLGLPAAWAMSRKSGRSIPGLVHAARQAQREKEERRARRERTARERSESEERRASRAPSDFPALSALSAAATTSPFVAMHPHTPILITSVPYQGCRLSPPRRSARRRVRPVAMGLLPAQHNNRGDRAGAATLDRAEESAYLAMCSRYRPLSGRVRCTCGARASLSTPVRRLCCTPGVAGPAARPASLARHTVLARIGRIRPIVLDDGDHLLAHIAAANVLSRRVHFGPAAAAERLQ